MTDQLARLQAALTGRYTIERELGRGGMATVYLAHDLKHDRAVAIKVLQPELAATLGPARFLREIQIAARLAHPHILPLHDSGFAGEFLYYVMPYVEGESLRQRLTREPQLRLEETLAIGWEVADALSYAHGHDVVHRDIKPENILLTSSHALVADFGIAQAVTAAVGHRLTAADMTVGTVGYMSPEQAAHDPVDGRSDIYSLGCVIYEMLTGEPPFTGPTALAILADQSSDPVPRLHGVREPVPQAVQWAIGRALAPLPGDRFATSAQFAAALASARSVAPATRPVPPRRRLRGWLAVGAVAIVGLGVALRVGARSTGDGLGAEPKAVREDFDAATASPGARADLLRGRTRFWAGDLDGAAAAYRRAIAADSDLALAYNRLSVVETWRWDYPAARRAVEAGLARAGRLSPRWRLVLEAQRHYVMRDPDSTIAGFQLLAIDYPQMTDVWFGLGEALFHFGGVVGTSPFAARRVFEHLVALDSLSPVYYHLVDLALLGGDSVGARRFAAHIRADDGERATADAAIALTFGDATARARTMRSLQDADRQTLKFLVAHFAHGALNLPLVDTIARYLSSPDRTPDDRLTGAQYRLVALGGQGRWSDAVAVWDSNRVGDGFDHWMAYASLAGFPARAQVAPMYAWGRSLLAAGRVPNFERPIWDNAEQAFVALVHRAALSGDSSEAKRLIQAIDGGAPRADPSDPVPPALRAALLARLALLARDTARAVPLLELSVARSAEPFGMFLPLIDMAPERWMLAQFYAARGDRKAATRWLRSFASVWSLGDALYARRVDCLARRLGIASGPRGGPESGCKD